VVIEEIDTVDLENQTITNIMSTESDSL